jgi:hypothetical protein
MPNTVTTEFLVVVVEVAVQTSLFALMSLSRVSAGGRTLYASEAL